MTRDDLRRISRMRQLGKNGTARALREQSGLSQREFAIAIVGGANQSQLSKWECGILSPSARNALAWYDALTVITGRDLDTIDLEAVA